MYTNFFFFFYSFREAKRLTLIKISKEHEVHHKINSHHPNFQFWISQRHLLQIWYPDKTVDLYILKTFWRSTFLKHLQFITQLYLLSVCLENFLPLASVDIKSIALSLGINTGTTEIHVSIQTGGLRHTLCIHCLIFNSN